MHGYQLDRVSLGADNHPSAGERNGARCERRKVVSDSGGEDLQPSAVD
jgi:hypothetical protein